MKRIIPLTILALFALTGCSEENAAKITPYLGMKTLNEDKADAFVKIALQKASTCKSQDLDTKKFAECAEKAVELAMKADALYTKDCEYGNAAACRKRAELHQKWDTR